MNKLKLTLVVLLAGLALTACGTSSRKADDEPGKTVKAAETNTALGRQYMERGQYEVALEKLKRAVAYDKAYAPAHTLLGILYETLDLPEQAGDEYRLAVHYDPTGGDVNNNYAAFLCSQGKGNEADRYFQAAFEDRFYDTPEVAYANAGLCALGMNQLDKAERYLRQSLEYDAEISLALLSMASLNYQNGAYLGARAFLQRFESVEAANAQSLLLGYRIEHALGDNSASMNYKNELLSQFPHTPEAAEARVQD